MQYLLPLHFLPVNRIIRLENVMYIKAQYRSRSTARPRASLKTHTPWGQVQLSGQRYYNAEMGRWVSRDPVEEWGGPNTLAFVYNSAVFRIDPLGLDAEAIGYHALCL